MDVDSVAVAEAIRNRLQNPLEVSDVRPAYKNREEGTWSTIAPDSTLLLLEKCSLWDFEPRIKERVAQDRPSDTLQGSSPKMCAVGFRLHSEACYLLELSQVALVFFGTMHRGLAEPWRGTP